MGGVSLARGDVPPGLLTLTFLGSLQLILQTQVLGTFVPPEDFATRGPGVVVDAFLTVDARKQKKLASAAAMFLARHRSYANHVCRFDVIGIDRDDNNDASIRWIKDAFRPNG